MDENINKNEDKKKEFDYLDRIDKSSINVENRPFDIEKLKEKINRAN